MAALKSIKAMQVDLLNSYDFSMIWRITKICSVVLRPAVKPACSLRRWLWKVGLMANSFPGMESRVMPRWFEHTSLFPLFFQKGRMIPLRHSSGMFSLIHTMLIM